MSKSIGIHVHYRHLTWTLSAPLIFGEYMGNTLLFIVTLIYLGVAADYGFKGHIGMAVAFIAYAAANIGLIMASRGM